MPSIAKVIEVISEGTTIDEAVANAVRDAGRSVRGIRSAYVENIQAVVENGEVTRYRVNAKLTFVVE